MRNLLPVITVALAGCFYIDADDEQRRLDRLDSEPADTDVGLDLEVASVSPSFVVECDGAATLQVISRVNEAFEDTSFTVFARVDDGQDVPIGVVVSDPGISGFANLNFEVPLGAEVLAALASCGDASCDHELFIGVEAASGEQAVSPAFPIAVVGAWTVPPTAVTSLQDVEAARIDLASASFLSEVAVNPAGGVSSELYPTLTTVLSHPWFEAVDGAGDWAFTVVACPDGADPVDGTGCLELVPTVAYVDGALELSVPTSTLAERACADPSAPWDDLWLLSEGDACLATTLLPLEERAFRFVEEDCDGDGSLAVEDCDDADRDRSPAFVDLCDGIDDDCDGVTDVVVDLWPDGDDDGFGDAIASPAHVCPSTFVGSVPNGDDCDDGDVTIHPGAAETCDGVDTNCVGGESDAPAAVDAFDDDDGDSYGAGAAVRDCAATHAIEQRVPSSDDCNDSDASAFPGHPEVCLDYGVDNDCDGDNFDATDTTAWYLDSDKDGFGDLTATLACTAPPGSIATTLDCDDARPWVNPGRVEICDLAPDEDCDGNVDVGCSVGDACTDDANCTTGRCGTTGLCEPWTLWSSGTDTEQFGSVAVTSDGRRIWAFRTNSTGVSVDGVVAPGLTAGFDWVIVRADASGAVESASRLTTSGTDVPTVVVAEPGTGRYAVAGTVEINGSAAKLDGSVLFTSSPGLKGHPTVLVFDGTDSVDWSRHFYDTGDGVATGVEFAPDGDLFVGGVVNIGAPVNTTSEVFVLRVEEDPSSLGQGRQVWYRKFVSSGGDLLGGLAAAPGGDLVISGSFGAGASSPATLDLGNGCTLTADDTAGDAFLARLDGADGTCRWAVSLHQDGFFQLFDDVVVDPMGRVCAVGTSRAWASNGVGHPNTLLGVLAPITLGNVLGVKDVVVGCVEGDGTPLWLRAVGGPQDDAGFGAAIDASGDLVVVGAIGADGSSPANFGGGSVAGDSATDVFAARYSTRDGSFVDAGVWPAIGVNLLTNVVVDPLTGDVLVAGHSSGPMDFGDTLAGDAPRGKDGAFLASLGNGPFESSSLPVSCGELHDRYGALPSGVYPVDPDGPYGPDAFYARCDMTTDGGGWTRVGTFRGDTPICSMTNALGVWTATNLDTPAGTAAHVWLSSAAVAPMFVDGDVRLEPDVGTPYIFHSTAGVWSWPNIASGTVNAGNVATHLVTASTDLGVNYTPIENSTCTTCLLGGQISGVHTIHLGAGSSGQGSFSQGALCAVGSYAGYRGVAVANGAGFQFGRGGQIWVR